MPPLVAVCCQGADCLALVDAETGQRRGDVPVGGHPVHATTVDGRVFVATMDERAVSVVDTDGTVRRVETGVLGPSHFERAGDRLLAPCSGGDAVAVLDPARLELVGRVHVGAEPHELAVLDDEALVGSRADGSVTRVDLRTLDPVGETTVAADARVQGVEAGEDRAFAVDQRNAEVVAVDGGVVARADVGDDPYDLTVTAERVFVPGRGDGVVHEFDRDLRAVAEHATGDRPVAVAPTGDRTWVLHRETPALASLRGEEIGLPAGGMDVVDLGSNRVLVTHYDDAAASVVDLAAGRVETTVDLPANPLGAVVA